MQVLIVHPLMHQLTRLRFSKKRAIAGALMTQAGAGAVADVACAFADAVASVQPVDTYTRTASAPVGAAATPRKQRAGLKPGEWDPAQGDVAREGIAKRSYLQDMWYCVAAVPDGGLKAGKLYEASSMGKQITYWQGAHLLAIV